MVDDNGKSIINKLKDNIKIADFIEVESKALGVEAEEAPFEELKEPFDPSKIDVAFRTLTIDLLIKRIKEKEIVLNPDFQRKDVWDQGQKSRLIESILIRIPLPAFYIDGSEEQNWLVIDGQQRLNAINEFAIKNSLKLVGLEFLNQYEGKRFRELPRDYRRRLEETQITIYLIQPGTPPNVKFNIFKRINTGGLPLSPQEIRHALFQGKATKLLEQLSLQESFLNATTYSIPTDRMLDREFVLRFIAFYLSSKPPSLRMSLDDFLNDSMEKINSFSDNEIIEIESAFERSMKLSQDIFDIYAFRKRSEIRERRKPLNKALFECWSVSLANLHNEEISKIVGLKTTLLEKANLLFDDKDFDEAISRGTSDTKKVKARFSKVDALLKEMLNI